ncbi:hypothetical protein BJ138DRAFT_1168760 [Hygrophoropsis aurantiaca]|uniref:Uncharacterized protein n=1 Tax=Hygrophoropsis aurantiaca TaxID=72124 RepID=A0ACB7ZPW4_9AGAM|nr:hypothetical protein BJ138DRAFT_1168760 [Hygrophoropsis aurantiaca]
MTGSEISRSIRRLWNVHCVILMYVVPGAWEWCWRIAYHCAVVAALMFWDIHILYAPCIPFIAS